LRTHRERYAIARGGDSPELQDQRGRNTLAPVRCRNGQIVDVDLAAHPLELVQLIGRDAAHHLAVLKRGKRDEVIAAK